MGAFVYNPLKFIAELPPDSEAVQQILEHILSTRNNVTLAGLQSELQQEGFYELEALVGTIAETLLKQGEERGLAMGEKRGLAEGVERGLAEGVARAGEGPRTRQSGDPGPPTGAAFRRTARQHPKTAGLSGTGAGRVLARGLSGRARPGGGLCS